MYCELEIGPTLLTYERKTSKFFVLIDAVRCLSTDPEALLLEKDVLILILWSHLSRNGHA